MTTDLSGLLTQDSNHNATLVIRNATKTDSQAICDIYNYYIDNTFITFEEVPVTADIMAQRIEQINAKDPYLVLTENENILGYAYATEWKSRSAYRFSAETSIYLDHTVAGKGYGRYLYQTLLTKLKDTALHSVVGGIALPNVASVRLHERLGFVPIGCFKEIGFKHNQWIDVGYWQYFL